MRRLLLDTNVVSASRRPERQSEAFQSFLREIDISETFISVLTPMEIRFGIQREASSDPAFAEELARWLDGIILPAFEGRTLAFDIDEALRAGSLAPAQKRPTADAMIAATALVHGLVVATRNVADFVPLGVGCFNPWNHVAGASSR